MIKNLSLNIKTRFFYSLKQPFKVLLAILCVNTPMLFAAAPSSTTVTPEKAIQFFAQQEKIIVTFVGYSAAGYEQNDKMLKQARNILSKHIPDKTIVNIGATADGIGAVYELAKKMGFATTGIVSTQAKKYQSGLSPYVDKVFYIVDKTWGGFITDTRNLSPTSQAMVQSSTIIVGIGGGAVARDEMLGAQRMGKTVIYIPADMNHRIAINKAHKKNNPAPTDFKGAANTTFSSK